MWYHLHIWGYWYFSGWSWFQLVLHPVQHVAWCDLSFQRTWSIGLDFEGQCSTQCRCYLRISLTYSGSAWLFSVVWSYFHKWHLILFETTVTASVIASFANTFCHCVGYFFICSWFSLLCEKLTLGPIRLFCFYFFCLRILIQENIYFYDLCLRMLCLCSLLGASQCHVLYLVF